MSCRGRETLVPHVDPISHLPEGVSGWKRMAFDLELVALFLQPGVKTWETPEEAAPAATANAPQFNTATNIATNNLDASARLSVVDARAIIASIHVQQWT